MRKQFSKSDVKQFLTEHSFAADFMDKKSNVVQEDQVLIINKEPLFLLIDNQWIPSLRLLLKKLVLPKVVVDKGAIKFVVNGADVMRPGITTCDEFVQFEYVVIVDETLGKPIAVGQALLASDRLLEEKGGKVIKNLHFIGDEYWNTK